MANEPPIKQLRTFLEYKGIKEALGNILSILKIPMLKPRKRNCKQLGKRDFHWRQKLEKGRSNYPPF
jgi:hypothetical protein